MVRAQEIRGMVKDTAGLPLAGASVVLKTAKDSALVKISVTTTDGQYIFTGTPPGKYVLTVSHTGYSTLSSAGFPITDSSVSRIPLIVLTPATRELRQAEVTASRPLVEVRPDRIVVNVANTINAVGEDALDLIRKSPGVTVDNNNVISIGGKSGVQVFVDGRPTYLTGAGLAAYLKTLQSSSIESIQLISNPSARFEAAGTAGIIDIRLKKDSSLGTNITATAGYAIGTYSKYDGGVSFNHRDRKLNVFGDYNYHNAITDAHSVYYRSLPDTLFRQQDALVTRSTSQTWHAGLDYSLDRTSTLGVLISGTLATDSFLSNSNTPIIYRPTNTTDRLLVADNRTSTLQDDYDFNLNYRYAGKEGSELDLNGDYALFRLRSNQLQPNAYFDSTGQHFLYSNDYNILSPTDIDIYSFKADYSRQALGGQLAAGMKFSFVNSINEFNEYDLQQSIKVLDSLSSNHFKYKENINAVYIDYTRVVKKGLTLQAGLRIENTNSRGNSMGWQQAAVDYTRYDSVYPRHYTDLFPSLSLHWHDWTLSYSRRVDRPDYQDLNPFVFKIDDYTYSKGNTQLQPQYGNNLNLTWAHWNSLPVTFTYSHISNLFTVVTDTTDRSKSVNTKVNLASQDVAGLNISYSFRLKWYSGFVNVNGFYAHYGADLGVGKRIDEQVINTTIVSQHTFQLGKGWSASLREYLSTPNIVQATLKSRTLWSLDGGLQKTLFNGRATVKASVSDIFYTLHWALTSNFAGQDIYAAGSTESRQFKVNFTYRFGNNQMKAARRHLTGAEDERKRVDTSGAP
jgi:hypothetical protein